MELVVVPAYNEAKVIGRVVRDLFQHGFNNVLVVDDGSADNTAEVASASGAKVLIHKINRGQGAALETGNEYARRSGFDVVVHFDGDDQFNPEDIRGALKQLELGYDVVLGSKFLDKRSDIPWSKRLIFLPIARVINRFLTGVSLTDVHNGFRILNRRALERVVITQDGMAHNSEIVAALKKNNLRFVECPVEVRYHRYGRGLGEGFKIIFDWVFKK